MDSPPALLVFGAHPDDIEFGCGAIVALEAQHGRQAHFVIGSRGEAATNGTPAQRTAEAEAAAGVFGASLEFVDIGGDAHLRHEIAHVLRFAAIIRRVRPQWVLAPTTAPNQHPDHVAIGTMVRDAARVARFGGVTELREQPPHEIAQLLHYAITVEAESTSVPPVIFDVSDEAVMRRWSAAMDAHASQHATRNYVELQLTRARVLGLRTGCAHAWPLFPNDPLVFESLQPLARAARRF